jgi:Mrp family chromosome partitioning ATPase
VVTSTVSGEGKSTVALNLALALGQLGNVLLIDADMRRPSLARQLGRDTRTPGLTDLVAGTVKVTECIHAVPGDIHVLFAGSTVPPIR